MPTRQKLLIIFLFISSLTFYTLYAYENALEVRTDVPGVSVFIDSVYKGESQPFGNINIFRLDDIKPGQHNLKCKYKDYEPFTDSITTPKEGTTNIEVNFLLKDIEVVDITQKGEGQQLKRTGTIFVRSKPTGAKIYLNGQLIMNEDEEIIRTDSKLDKIPIGDINVKCTFGSDKILKGNFKLAASDTVRVMADFFENKMIIKVKYRITIASDPEGSIYLNDKYIGDGSETIKLPRGSYQVRIKREGYKTVIHNIQVTEENLYTYKLPSNSTSLNIKTKPVSGAEVWINGEKVGKTPYFKPILNAGTHSLKIKRKGYKTIKKDIEIKSTLPYKKTIMLELSSAPFKVTTTPVDGAEVWLDGEKVGYTPYYDSNLNFGNYKLKIKKDGFCTVKGEITVNKRNGFEQAIILSKE